MIRCHHHVTTCVYRAILIPRAILIMRGENLPDWKFLFHHLDLCQFFGITAFQNCCNNCDDPLHGTSLTLGWFRLVSFYQNQYPSLLTFFPL